MEYVPNAAAMTKKGPTFRFIVKRRAVAAVGARRDAAGVSNRPAVSDDGRWWPETLSMAARQVVEVEPEA